MNNLVVVSNAEDLEFFHDSGIGVMEANDYLKQGADLDRQTRIFNLCRDYSYGKRGYYVSLMAEARGHKCLPSASAILDLQKRSSSRFVGEQVIEKIQKNFSQLKVAEYSLSIYFGKNLAEKHLGISRQLFSLVRAPLIRAEFVKREDEWSLKSVKAISLKDVPENHRGFLLESIREYFSSGVVSSRAKKAAKYEVAILVNPNDPSPPSNKKALKKFVEAGQNLRIQCDFVEEKDIALISKFDGLFIRDTTDVSNYTFQFAQKAEKEGLIVIDDPLSIIRCCNKVYLHDLLTRKKVPIPSSRVILKNQDLNLNDFVYPVVLKKPDSAFSVGVSKVTNADQLNDSLKLLFKESDLVIVQEFLSSDYDWRVGLIDSQPIFVCKYFMAKDHWQIYNHGSQKDGDKVGMSETLGLSEVKPALLNLAKRACESIGDGLYGVDIKEVNGKYYVIEVNDNPNIDRGIEDEVTGDALYLRIMASFLHRLELR